jgi:hypothetical protein
LLRSFPVFVQVALVMFPDNDLFSTPLHLGPLLSDAGGHFVTVFANGPVPAEITLPMADSI